jgi:hypothetical protein
MTIENDALREDLRAWIKSPAIGLPDYSADLLIRRRVGGMLADVCAKHSARAPKKVVNSVQNRFPDKSLAQRD